MAQTQTKETPNQKLFIVNKFCFFSGVREIKLSQECFWVVLLKLALTASVLWWARSTRHYLPCLWSSYRLPWPILLTYHEFSCACLCLCYCAASQTHQGIWDSDCFLARTSRVSLLCFSNQFIVVCSLERLLWRQGTDHITVLCSLWSVLPSTEPYFAAYVNPYCLETQVSTILPQFFFLVCFAPTFSVTHPCYYQCCQNFYELNFGCRAVFFHLSLCSSRTHIISSHRSISKISSFLFRATRFLRLEFQNSQYSTFFSGKLFHCLCGLWILQLTSYCTSPHSLLLVSRQCPLELSQMTLLILVDFY